VACRKQAVGLRKVANRCRARRFAKKRRISSLLGCPPRATMGMKMGGTRRGIAQGKIRARHEDSPKGGEFRACWGARMRATMGMKVGGTPRDFREGENSSQARRFAKRRRISSLLGRPLAGNDGNENGGNASGYRAGANSSQARRFAKRRRISSLARICGGHGFAACAPARDFRGWHRFAVYASNENALCTNDSVCFLGDARV